MLELQLIGNLGKDPEGRYTQDGVFVCTFPVAVTTRKDETVWVEVSAWRELGERCHQFLAKGRQVFVRGTPAVEAFIRKNGEAGASLKVTAQTVQFLGVKGGDTGEGRAIAREEEIPF